LGSLAAFHSLPASGRAHRAMADAQTAAALLQKIRSDLRFRFGVQEPRHSLLMKLQAVAKKNLAKLIEQHAGEVVGAPLPRPPSLGEGA
jgi:DNA polymerase III subunit epsilon